MKVIGTDKNGDEIAEVSVTELDAMFKEIRAKAIDEFAEELLKVSEGDIDIYVWCSDIKRIAAQMKAGEKNG